MTPIWIHWEVPMAYATAARCSLAAATAAGHCEAAASSLTSCSAVSRLEAPAPQEAAGCDTANSMRESCPTSAHKGGQASQIAGWGRGSRKYTSAALLASTRACAATTEAAPA